MREKLLKKKKIYSGKILNLFADNVLLPNGKTSKREYIHQPNAVAAIPFIDNKRIILVKQFRYPIHEITYELPAGKIAKKEKPLICIKRELEEETGFTSNNIKKLISFYPSTAFSTEVLHIFTAKNLRKVKTKPDEDEFIESEIVHYEKALEWISSGKILDAKTIIGLLYYRIFPPKADLP
ncbi:MAG: NUDIX hydrolase [Elusimicrobia bacterium]|nr:NUDIX hydrolase [Elusimicrobiota bacterium]